MRLIEKFVLSKTGNLDGCEDIIVFNDYFAAVIDGATARNNTLYSGKKSGLKAALLTQTALERLPEDADLQMVLDCVTDHFTAYYREIGIKTDEYDKILTASAVLLSRYHRQIWLIGDCRCRVGDVVYENPNGIDDFVADVRSFINQAELLKGRSEQWIMEQDPGAQYIKGLLVDQFLFQNHKPERTTGAFHYAAIDGRPIHIPSIKTISLGEHVEEVILASDGYPVLCGNLEESERVLAKLLEEDPLCIFTNKCVKGKKDNLVSYDDRAYLRFRL